MNLSVLERLQLPSLYPQTSTIENQLLVKQMMEKVALTLEEMKKIGGRDEKRDVVCPNCKNVVREAEPMFIWDDDEYEKEIQFSEAELVLLKQRVDELNAGAQITQQMLSVCQKVSSLFPKKEKKK